MYETRKINNRKLSSSERDHQREKIKMALKNNPSVVKRSVKHWSMGLLESMQNPDEIIKKTDSVVAIRDKFPKAKVHYLVIPYQDISTIDRLDRSHISLLQEFGKMFEEIQGDLKDVTLRAGFHAVPSMCRLHMHIISIDMISKCLKTKKHWNSFTTKFFIPYEDVLKQLEVHGAVKKISSEEVKTLLNTPLICNQCSSTDMNIPQLKEHLLTHAVP